MKIFFTRQSNEHLENIYQFYLPKNEQIAVDIYNQILEEIEFLKKQPYMAALVPLLAERAYPYRGLVVRRSFKVIYYVENDTIMIADVWDCRQDPVKHTENLS
ncbi:MAG: type II toxin-antitoxin system RelE/ParE family toxin [Candidatus Azobacteroides sp.]|nr:type II toxin-antitoxin system RelE/ParE family toxin [Candidatus Azobacteroides sp.]